MDQSAIEAYLTKIRAAKDAQMRPCGLVTPAFISTPAHRVGVAHLFLRPRFLLGDPVGSGKTPQALVAYGYLKEKDPGLKLLVVTTMSAQFQWVRSTHRFLRGISATVYGYEGLTKLDPRKRPVAFRRDLPTTDVWMTTYAMLAQEEGVLLAALDRFVLILDEGHSLKSHTGEVLYPAALRASQKARCTWALTATPLKKGRLSELYAVFQVVRPGTFPAHYNTFRKTYFILKLVHPRWKIKYGPKKGQPAPPFYEEVGEQNQDHLQALISRFYLKRPAAELAMGLPSHQVVESDVFLEAKQLDLYRACLAKGEDEPARQLAALTEAQQAISCPAVLGHAKVPNAKWAELKRLLLGDFTDEKVIIYSRFERTISWLSQQLTTLGLAHGRVTGQETLKARESARLRFQTDPAFNLILLTDAGGEALDLQAARIVVFYDLPWSWGSVQQVVGRMLRRGSVHALAISHLLVAHPTIDEIVLEQLRTEEITIRRRIPETEPLLTTETETAELRTGTETATATASPIATATDTATATTTPPPSLSPIPPTATETPIATVLRSRIYGGYPSPRR